MRPRMSDSAAVADQNGGGKSTQVNAVSLPGEAALMRQFLCASQVKAGSIPCIRHG